MIPKPKPLNIRKLTPTIKPPENLFIMEEDLRTPHEGRQKLNLNYSHPSVKKIDRKALEYAMALSETSGVSPDRFIKFLQSYKGKTPKNDLMKLAIESRNKRLEPEIERENKINENRKNYFVGK